MAVVTEANDERTDKTEVVADERIQKAKYGGFNFGAGFFGWIVAVGSSVLLVALLSAIGGAIALTSPDASNTTLNQGTVKTVGIASGIMLLIALGIAYYAGGYVAGRMSRFDGARQGFGVWVIGFVVAIVLAVLGAVLGSSYNLLQQVNLPSIPVGTGSLTAGGLITLLAILVVTLVTAILGGKVGQNYHVKVDRTGVRRVHAE